MRKVMLALFILLNMGALPALAADRPASEASIRHLLEVTKAKKLADSMMSKMDEIRDASMKQSMSGQVLTPRQEEVMLEMNEKMTALLKEELDWDRLEPMYVEIYRESFSQKEVDGMLSFYETPAGQAVIKKMPGVLETTMQRMQKRMAILLPKVQSIAVEGMEKMNKASSEE